MRLVLAWIARLRGNLLDLGGNWEPVRAEAG
jgi:hypothetical protein